MSLFLIKRSIKYWFQRRFRGFSDDKTWSLDHTVAEFTLPRLKRFKEVQNGYPADLTEEQWDDIIDKMILAFENVIKEFNFDEEDGIKEAKEIEEGMILFGKYFRQLWW